MYDSETSLSSLRQGDVISCLHLPRFTMTTASFLHHLNGDDDQMLFQNRVILDVNNSMAVVLSQCCEFNEGKRNSFSISELFPFRKLLTPKISLWGINIAELIPVARSPFRGKKGRELDFLDQLRRANQVSTSERNEALNAFLFEPDGNVLKEPYVADFSRVTSFSIKDLPRVLKGKCLQLDQVHRRQFQTKLAYFYGRSAEEA